MRKIIFLLFLTVSSLFAQDPNWSSFVTFPAYPSPFYDDWERNPNIGSLTINYMGTAPVQFYFEVIISLDEYGEAIKGRTENREYLSGPVSETLTFNDIADWQNTDINTDLENLIIQTGKLPEADYTICVNTRALNGELLTDACTNFEIALPNPPQLISPEDEGSIDIAQPTFMWNPINAPAEIVPYYHLKIVEILEGQTSYRALEANVPIVETEIPYENLYIYHLDDYPLEQSHSYAWQVQATNDEGVPIATNEGFSEIWKFTYGNTKGEISIDTLMLIEDFAYLIDIQDLNITDNSIFLNLDGSCRMMLKDADGIDKFVDVFAQNLMLQKDETFENPIFLGGNILGSIYDDVFSSNITGKYFHPTELEFIPPNQLTIGGNFYLGEEVDIPLNGRLSYIDGELLGELALIGDPTAPIFEMGDDSFKMNITSLALSYPSIETNLEGRLSIFGTPSNCTITEIELDKNGSYAANISCDVMEEISLLQGSTVFKMGVNRIEGKISGNLISKEFDYSVIVDGNLLFDTGVENSVGAEMIFQLQPNNFKLLSFIPSADVNASTLDLGWLKWNMQNMKLNDLAYQNGNWDFDLSMDIDISFPDFTDETFPKVSGVSFTPRGFEFPKIDFSNFSLPNIDFAGFGLEIFGLRSKPFTFDLTTWSQGTIANISFDFDAILTMPNLPEGTASDLLSNGIKINPTITGGRFSFDIPEIKFKNPLSMPIANGIKFNVRNLLGSIGSDYDGSLFSYLPKIKFKGDLELPEGFSCEGENQVLPIKTELLVSGDGELTGIAKNIIPECPIKMGIATFYFTESEVEFTNTGEPAIILRGGAAVKFTENENADPIGKLKVEYDILNNNLISVEGEINSKFKLDLLPDNPFLSFEINSAEIKNKILTIDGRNKLAFNNSGNIGVTFDKLKINLEEFKIESGSVFFDSGFNLKITGIEDGELAFEPLPLRSKLNGEAGLMISFPEAIGLDKNGFSVVGDCSAEIVFNGKEYSDISANFSKDFAINIEDFSVKQGIGEFFFKGNRLAYWNEEGLIPDMSFFMNYIIPDRIPLPTLDIAYLQVRRNDSLLVQVTPNGDEIEIATFDGKPIPLVFTGIQFDKPLPPSINVDFNITLNTNSEEVTEGSIYVSVPEMFRADFDLSQVGIPYQIYSIYYGEIDGDYAFRLTGKPKFFETEFTCSDSVSLAITRDGVLSGRINCDLETIVPMVPNSDKLNLILNNVTGNFNVDLPARSIDFDFELDSDIKFKVSEEEDWGVWTLLGVTPEGIDFRDSRVDPLAVGKIALENFELGISNLSLPNLSYSSGSGGGWNFEFGMDLEMSFPQFDFSIDIPSEEGMSFTKSGFHFPNISIGDLPDSLKFELGGFELQPIAFRMPSFDFNWLDPTESQVDWNFKFDFNINFPNVQGAMGNMLTPNLTMRDVGFTSGLFVGSFPTIEYAPDVLGLDFGNGFNFNVVGISGRFFDDNGSQGIDFKFKGKLKMPKFASCKNDDGTIYDISDTEFSFSSNGFLSGRLENFAPTCPIDLGLGKFNITSSSLDFVVTDNKQEAMLGMTGDLKIPTGGADSVTANGTLVVDLVNGKIIDGEVRIDEQFVFSIPSDNPVLKFTVNSAVLNQNGLAINGNSQILLDGGHTLPVNFDDFLFDPFKFEVVRGSITIEDDIALKLFIKDGGIDYTVVPYDFTLTEEKTAKIGLAGGITLDINGLTATGEAIAAIYWSNEYNFGNLRARFSNDFKMKTKPFGVKEGKVDIILVDENSEENNVASYDKDGLHLGDIFGIIPIPEKIPLPDNSIAYLQIKNGENVLVETESVDRGMRISTRDGETVKLVMPALKYNNENAPEVNVTFNVILNTTSWEFVDGEIIVEPGDGEVSIIDLKEKGIPVDIIRVRYGKNSDDEYALTANAKFQLPSILGEFPVELENMEINENGISGNINVGEYYEAYPQRVIPTISHANVGDNAIITLEGIEASFGETKSLKFSGKFIPTMFVTGEGDAADTSDFHYAATWTGGQNDFSFFLDLPDGESVNMGVAQFIPTSIHGVAAMELQFKEAPSSDFELILNGEILVDEFGDGFSLDFRNLKVSNSGITVDAINLDEEDAIEFKLFNSPFRIYNVSPSGKAIQFTFNDNVLKFGLSGDIEFFGKKIEFENFVIGTDGTFSFPAVNFLGTPLVIVDNFLTLNELKLDGNKLTVNGKAKLPKPAEENSEFTFGFSIGADGTLYNISNSEFVFINDERQGKGNDDTEYDFWVGDFDPTYLSLLLDFENLSNSKIRLVADIYFNNDPLGIGSKGLNTLNPGFEVDFNGNVTWGEVSIPESYSKIDWEMLQIDINEISLTGGSGIGFEMVGSFGINIADVGGSGINFGGTERGGLRITSEGGIENFSNSISGGEITIVDLVKITVDNVGFSSTPTDIEITSNSTRGSNHSSETRTIHVDNYFRFGGSIDVAGYFKGGIDEFLTYNAGDSYALVIRNAHLNVTHVIDARVDLIYESNNSGYKLLAGGRGQLADMYEVTVVGKIATNSFGLFVAVDNLDIHAGPVTIEGIGGGFFYNPTSADIRLVKSMAGLNNPTVEGKISNSGMSSSFAVFLYGSLALVDDTIISGKVLLTVTGNKFTMDGKVVILSQGEDLYGLVNLQVDFVNGYFDGNIYVYLNVVKLVEGDGELSFYVYDRNTWGVMGNINLEVVKFFEMDSKFFVGPSGFLVSFNYREGFDIWIIEVNAGFESQLWYIQDVSWGAYAEAYIYADIKVADARGTLRCALFGEPNFYIYGEAKVKGSCLGIHYSKTVSATISSSGVDGSFSSDSKMNSLIREARGLAEEAEAEANAIREDINNRPPPEPAGITVSEEDLAAAYSTLSEWGRMYKYGDASERSLAWQFFNDLRGVEVRMNRVPVYGGQDGEWEVYRLVIEQIYEGQNAPTLNDYTNRMVSLDSMITAYTQVRSDYLVNFDATMESIETITSEPDTLERNPADLSNFSEPEFEEYYDEATNETKRRIVPGTQPSFNIDEELASTNENKLTENKATADVYQDYVFAQLDKINRNIANIENILVGENGNSGAEKLSSEYLGVISKIGGLYAAKYIYDKKMFFWGEDAWGKMRTNKRKIRRMFYDKAKFVYNRWGWEALRDLQVARAEKINELAGVNTYSGVEQEWNDYHENASEFDFFNWAVEESRDLGLQLWFDLPYNGLENLKGESRGAVANDITLHSEKVEDLRSYQAGFTIKMDELYSTLAEMYEVKYDLLNSLIDWKKAKNEDVKLLNSSRNAISNKMKMPRISTLSVLNLDKGLYSQSYITWNSSGANSSNTKYLIDFSKRNPDVLPQGLQAVGNSRLALLYNFAVVYKREFGPTTFTVNARNPVGYKINKSLTFTPTFSNTKDITFGGIDLTESEVDYSPPIVSSKLNFPESYTEKRGDESTGFAYIYFIGNSNIITASWEATDEESGIREYLYKLVEVENPYEELGNNNNNRFQLAGNPVVNQLPDMNLMVDREFYPTNITGTPYAIQCQPRNVVRTVIPQTTNNGRPNVSLNTITLEDKKAYKLIVSAVNGDGINSYNCAGLSQYLIVDTSPPTKPERMYNAYPVYREMSYGATTVNPAVDLPTLTGGHPFNYNNVYKYPLNISRAEYSCSWGWSSDPESDIHRFEYRVTKVGDETVHTDWVNNGLNTEVLLKNETLGMNILNFVDSFYVDVRAVNYAQLASEPLRYYFRPVDPTVPTNVDVSLAYSNNGERAALVFNRHSTDNESSIDYYEVALGYRTDGNMNYLSWENAIHIKPSDINVSNGTVQLPKLPEHLRSYIAVRAVNKQGMHSRYCYTGPYYQDDSRPLKPRVSISKYAINGQGVLNLNFSNVRDPQSGIKKVRYRILKQNIGERRWAIAKDWSNSSSISGVALRFSDIGINLSHKVRVSVNSYNPQGMSSVTAVKEYVLDTTPPAKPGIVASYSSSIKDHSQNVNFRFTNVEDNESGIEKVEYAVVKGLRYGNHVSGSYYIYPNAIWRDNGTNTSKLFKYSDLGAVPGSKIKVFVRTTNRRGLVSETGVQVFTMP